MTDIQSLIAEWWDKGYETSQSYYPERYLNTRNLSSNNDSDGEVQANDFPNERLRDNNWVEGLNAFRFVLLWTIIGPPPLSREQIKRIPKVKITQNHVEQQLQCTICMIEFNMGQNVKRLICGHYFHDDCVTGWLQRHGTCPNCRRVLSNTRNHRLNCRIVPHSDGTSTLEWATPQ